MVQLLRYATRDSSHAMDKFVFLSDTTLPVKPFSYIYGALTEYDTSDVCIEPRDEWVWLTHKTQPGASATIVKHSQWVVLNKDHAKKLMWNWPHVAGSSYHHWKVPVW